MSLTAIYQRLRNYFVYSKESIIIGCAEVIKNMEF